MGGGGGGDQKVCLNRPKLREVVPLGLLTYGIKNFCRCQNPYGFDGPLKIENLPFLTFFKMTKPREIYTKGRIFFSIFFLKMSGGLLKIVGWWKSHEVVGRSSVGGNFEKIS